MTTESSQPRDVEDPSGAQAAGAQASLPAAERTLTPRVRRTRRVVFGLLMAWLVVVTLVIIIASVA